MSLTVRQRIIDAIAIRFATITIANGYQTGIGAKVTQWNTLPIDQRTHQGVDISDPTDAGEPVTSSQGEDHTLDVFAIIHAREAGVTPEYLRNAICDIYRAIGSDRYWTVSAARLAHGGTKPVKDEIAIDQQGKITGGARVHFQVMYRTQTLNPFVLK